MEEVWITRRARFVPDRRDDLREWCLPYLDQVVEVTKPDSDNFLTGTWWYLADQDWRVDGPWLWFEADDLVDA